MNELLNHKQKHEDLRYKNVNEHVILFSVTLGTATTMRHNTLGMRSIHAARLAVKFYYSKNWVTRITSQCIMWKVQMGCEER